MAKFFAILCGIYLLSLYAHTEAQTAPPRNALPINPSSLNESYESASQAFADGDYAAALAQFEQLQRQFQSAETVEDLARYHIVQYNLAVCYFKLGQYDSAYTLFKDLVDDSDLGWWATYNRAVIDQLQSRYTAAEAGLWAVIANTDDDALLDLATLQYQKLIAKQRSDVEQQNFSAPSQWSGALSLAYGYDDNVVDLARLNTSEVDDTFGELLVDVGWQSNGDNGPDWQWDTFAYTTQFNEVDDADYVVVNSSLAKNFYHNHWQMGGRIGIERSQAGGEDYLSANSLRLYAVNTNPARSERWRMAYQYQDIAALSTAFEQLEGTIHELELGYERDLSEQLRWSLRYDLAIEDRVGIRTATSFASLSPTRNRVDMRWLWQRHNWLHILSLGYRHSRYGEHNLLTPRIAIRRADEQFNLLLRTEYFATSDWSLFAEWTYVNNDSTVTTYDYDESIVSLGVSREF